MNYLMNNLRCFIIIILSIYSISVKSQNISYKEKIYALSKIWSEVKYNYIFYEDIEPIWDSLYDSYLSQIINTRNDFEIKNKLRSFISELHEGHSYVHFTEYYTPIYYYQLVCISSNNKIIVSANSVLNAKKIPICSEILEINNINVFHYLDSIYKESSIRENIKYQILAETFLYKNRDSILTIKYIDNIDKQIKTIKLKGRKNLVNWKNYYKTYPSKSTINMLSDSILYIYIKDFNNESFFYKIQNSKQLLEQSKGLIIDLRHNLGGSDIGYIIYNLFTKDTVYNQYIKHKINNSYLKARGAYADKHVLKFMNRDSSQVYFGYYKSLKSWYDNFKYKIDTFSQPLIKDNYAYSKKIVLLTDERTASSAELFIVGMKTISNPIIVGQETYGSVGHPLFFYLFDGSMAQICASNVVYKNKDYQYTKPDFYIEPSIENIKNNQDVVLIKALNLFK